jgi:hypothetical protein
MHIQDFAKAYETKTDEELQELSEDSEQLTPEACAALRGELAKRRIRGVDRLDERAENKQSRVENASNSGTPLLRAPHEVGEFVAEVLRTYHEQFWLFIKLTVPAVVVGYIAIIMSRNVGREIARPFPGVGILGHTTEILQIWFAVFAGYITSWIVFSFSFAAICSAVRRVAVGDIPSVEDSFANVRARIGSFLRLALLLFLLFLVAEAASLLLSGGIFWMLHQRQVHLTAFLFQIVSFGSVGLFLVIFSRFGLAIPAFVLGNYGVRQAMFRSDELTQGKWSILTVLLVKSVVGSYVAGMLPFWLASRISAGISLPSWFPWALSAASIGGVTAVEPTMFIGFALLYLRMSRSSSTPSEVPSSHFA